jgi:glycosyltransferase involved in cell wall biosynthesis
LTHKYQQVRVARPQFQEAEATGRRGRQAVEKKYNWGREAKKLIALYQRLLED